MVGEGFADVLNRSLGYKGIAAQAGVFVNEPIVHAYGPGTVRIAGVNERIVEVPFVFRESHRFTPGSRVIDVGASESLVSLSLASLGHQVTAVDPRGYLVDHPNLTQVRSTLQELDSPEPFDAAVLLSMIEHVGIDHYEQAVDPDADLQLMARLRELVRPEGLLLLTTPFGRARDAGFQRIYDDVRLRRLLEGWTVSSVEVVEQTTPTSWVRTDLGIEPIEDDVSRVVMVVASRSKD
jgi:2-polyprenyl-3-methyl-5-hydroxy-6-metoxy-1,4-benzoquinol methylase